MRSNYHIWFQPSGQQGTLGSRLIPKDNFISEEGQSELVDLMVSLPPTALVCLTTPVLFNATSNATSVTPAWRDALWHVRFSYT